MPELLCPVCGAPLRREDRAWRCENRHCFDVARSGYVNLLPPSPAGRRHGDDRRMVDARTAFLSRGYYAHLEQAVAALSDELTGPCARIVDAGCGEGTYDRRVLDRLRGSGKDVRLVGIDISTDAVRRAARLVPEGIFCAASTAAMPLPSGSAGLLLNIFSPFMPEEFRRVLAADGYLLRVVPLERHLWELKELIYDTPYENPPFDPAADGFDLVRTERVEKTLLLTEPSDLQNLFQMTPYYYKTGAADQQKLSGVQSLRVTTQFGVAVYRKSGFRG